MVNHVARSMSSRKEYSILEPSVGDGMFIESILNSSKVYNKNLKLTCVELIQDELLKVIELIQDSGVDKWEAINDDFLNYHKETKEFDFIIGNPPYVKKNFLNAEQIVKAKKVHSECNLKETSFKNLWSAFLLKCSSMLSNEGVLAFVLPSELLQVKFSESIRQYLVSNFERTEIFTFDELMFDAIGQDTVVIICYKKAIENGQFYCHVRNQEELIKEKLDLKKNRSITKYNTKWTHHILDGDEIEFINQLKSKCLTTNDYCVSKPGIVTAANNYFIVDEATGNDYGLEKFLKPIIQKSIFVNGSVVFDIEDFRKIERMGKPSQVLCLKNEIIDGDKRIRSYLDKGENELIHQRYKCQKRNKWYEIPNIGIPPEGMFFKRCYEYPKFLKNDAEVLVTDSAYQVQMKDDYSINSLVYSFYNSFTLLNAELDGRYYGGGVLELTPIEFKNLPIPYVDIKENEFDEFRKRFEKKVSIEEVLNEYDYLILNRVLKLSSEEIEKLQGIRKKLQNRRMRIVN